MNNKKLVRDILLSIPLGLLYVFFFNKKILLLKIYSIFEEKIKKAISISFICVIVGYILAFKIFNNGKLKNRIVKYSLTFGSSIILINSIIYHWPELNTDTKTFMIGVLFLLSIILSYKI